MACLGLCFQITCWEAVGTETLHSQKWLLLRNWSQPRIPSEESWGRATQESESPAEAPGLWG